MCGICGCGQQDTQTDPHDHPHPHPAHDPDHPHGGHGHSHHAEHLRGPHALDGHEHLHETDGRASAHGRRVVAVEEELLLRNNLLAERNRGWLAAREVLALNLVSSPGAGKTALLERTLSELGAALRFYVIEGDQQTDNDARRIAATGAPVRQINTGPVCHLDARMIDEALGVMQPAQGSVLMIENVGNLVCPALFDLGEAHKVVIASVTEGEDKPIKYPYMFRAAELIVLNKVDLLPHLDFDVAAFTEMARRVRPEVQLIPLSVRDGQGMENWYAWLREHQKRQGAPQP